MTTQALQTQSGAPYGLGRLSHRAAGSTSYIYDSTAGSGVTIYVVDTGVYLEHSEFGGRATWGANFISGSPVSELSFHVHTQNTSFLSFSQNLSLTNHKNTDEYGHGTHCAGTAAGSTYGISKKASIVAVKVLDKNGSGTFSGVISGIQWVATNAVPNSVLTMSLGGGFSSSVNSAVASAVNAGVTVVVAAGNSNADASGYSPASEPSAITVAASDSTDVRASFSNYGSLIDVFGPGVNVLSSWIGGTTATNTISGTSMGKLLFSYPVTLLRGLELTRFSYTTHCWSCSLPHWS